MLIINKVVLVDRESTWGKRSRWMRDWLENLCLRMFVKKNTCRPSWLCWSKRLKTVSELFNRVYWCLLMKWYWSTESRPNANRRGGCVDALQTLHSNHESDSFDLLRVRFEVYKWYTPASFENYYTNNLNASRPPTVSGYKISTNQRKPINQTRFTHKITDAIIMIVLY